MLRLTGTVRVRIARLLVLSVTIVLLSLGAAVTWRQTCIWRMVSDSQGAVEAGDIEGALRSIENGLRTYPGNAQVQYAAAVTYRRAGLLADADRWLRQASRIGCPDPRIELQRCLTVAQSGRVDEAKPRLHEIIRCGAPDDDAHQIYEALVKGYMASYRLKDAWDCLEYWTAWRPATANARLWRADIYQRMGDSKSAVREYEEILSDYPNHFESRLKLAELRLDLQDVVAARRDFEFCLAAGRDHPAVLLGLAKCNKLMGESKLAAKFAEQVLAAKATPRQQADAWVVLGQLWSVASEPQKAIGAFGHAVELVPTITEAHHGLTQAYSAMGNKELAEKHWHLAVQVSAENIRITEIVSKLANNPAEIDLRCELARILLRQGRREEAMRWLWTAMALVPEHKEAHQLLAEIARDNSPETPTTDSGVAISGPSTGPTQHTVPTAMPAPAVQDASK